jgi:hypothetical protein
MARTEPAVFALAWRGQCRWSALGCARRDRARYQRCNGDSPRSRRVDPKCPMAKCHANTGARIVPWRQPGDWATLSILLITTWDRNRGQRSLPKFTRLPARPLPPHKGAAPAPSNLCRLADIIITYTQDDPASWPPLRPLSPRSSLINQTASTSSDLMARLLAPPAPSRLSPRPIRAAVPTPCRASANG